MPDIELVTAKALYEQTVFPRTGFGSRQGTQVSILGEFQVPLRSVTERDAPPVARLGFAHGGAIVLRGHAGLLYRPVLAPRSHEPLDVEGFTQACRGDLPWRDYPFRDRDGYGYDDHNREPESLAKRDRSHERDEWRRVGENGMAKVAERVAQSATGMLVVDGIVHVACPQPRLVLKTRREPGKPGYAMLLTWSLPRLDGDDDPVLGPSVLEEPKDEWQRKQNDPILKRLSFADSHWRWFGLRQWEAAEAFGAEVARLQGIPFEAQEDAVAVLDPRPLAPYRGPDPRASAKDAMTRVGLSLERNPRPVIEAWLDGRDALARGDYHACMTRLAGALGLEDPAAPPAKALNWDGNLSGASSTFEGGPILLRYVMVEGREAPTPEQSEEDALSLSALAAR